MKVLIGIVTAEGIVNEEYTKLSGWKQMFNSAKFNIVGDEIKEFSKGDKVKITIEKLESTTNKEE